MSTLLIRHTDTHTEYAVMDGTSLVRYEKNSKEADEILSEQIFLARAERFQPGNKALFVTLDGKHTGFLPYQECKSIPSSGSSLLVQVKKPPVGNKAAYVTQDISVAGKYAILLPYSEKVSVSSRIQDPLRQQMTLLANQLRPEGMGLILRSEAAEADEEAVSSEIVVLQGRWKELLEKVSRLSAPKRVNDRISALEMILRDEKGLTDACSDREETLPIPCLTVEDPFTLHKVYDKLRKRLERNIWLPCGGYITVDPCEALTVIDVNSGKFPGIKKDRNAGIRKLNLEAAREIAHLMRLRNLSGIIIIDFVDMDTDEDREIITETFSGFLAQDPVKTVIHGFTALGLMEMTRKRTARICPATEE